MTTTYLTTAVIATGSNTDAFSMSGAGDILYVAAAGGAIMGFGTGQSTGLTISGTGAQAIIDGVVYGTFRGIQCNATSAVIQVNGSVTSASVAIGLGSGRLLVGPDGYVGGSQGVGMSGGTLINAGVIIGYQNQAIQLSGDGNRIINTGEINSQSVAIFIDADNTLIRNTGLIVGSLEVQFANESSQLYVTNAGRWIGDVDFTVGGDELRNSGVMGAVTLEAGFDSVVNIGLMGRVNLGDDADFFDTRHGQVDGLIIGGLGADQIFGGDWGETIVGDDGALGLDGGDVIRGGGGDDQVFGAIGADGLSGEPGDDTLRGGEQFDTLDGGRGDDLLFGDRGADVIKGGAGDDLMSGGDQSDTFIFGAGFGHDVITDFFAAAGGKHDVIQFSHATFADFAAVEAAATQAGSDVVIHATSGDTLVLLGVSLAAITADDFSFVA